MSIEVCRSALRTAKAASNAAFLHYHRCYHYPRAHFASSASGSVAPSIPFREFDSSYYAIKSRLLPVEVRTTPNRGKGLFAKQAIPAGATLFYDEPIFLDTNIRGLFGE